MARGYDDDAPCGRPATVRVTAACRHEHVSHDDVCGECVASLLTQQMVCVSCDELPVGAHVCPSVLVATDTVPGFPSMSDKGLTTWPALCRSTPTSDTSTTAGLAGSELNALLAETHGAKLAAVQLRNRVGESTTA